MINVTITTNMGRDYITCDEHDTVKSALEAKGVNYSVGMISLDGAPLRNGDINKSFAELGTTDSCFLSVIVKHDNAADGEEVSAPAAVAGVQIAASVVTVKSAFTPEELKMVKKFRPDALTIFDTEGGHKIPKFTIGVSSVGNGSVGTAGLSYGARAAADGKAMMVMEIPEGVDKVKEWAADTIGVAILKVRQIEGALASVIAEIKGEQAQVAAAITVL